MSAHITDILDNKGELCAALCTNVWSRDKQGNPTILWYITLPSGTYKQPLPVFTEWWEE